MFNLKPFTTKLNVHGARGEGTKQMKVVSVVLNPLPASWAVVSWVELAVFSGLQTCGTNLFKVLTEC